MAVSATTRQNYEAVSYRGPNLAMHSAQAREIIPITAATTLDSRYPPEKRATIAVALGAGDRPVIARQPHGTSTSHRPQRQMKLASRDIFIIISS